MSSDLTGKGFVEAYYYEGHGGCEISSWEWDYLKLNANPDSFRIGKVGDCVPAPVRSLVYNDESRRCGSGNPTAAAE